MPAMIVDWIYNNPTWLWGPILVALFIAVSCGGLLIFHRLVHVNLRRAHNDLAGFTFAIVGVLYALLLPLSQSPRGNLSAVRRTSSRTSRTSPAACTWIPRACRT